MLVYLGKSRVLEKSFGGTCNAINTCYNRLINDEVGNS